MKVKAMINEKQFCSPLFICFSQFLTVTAIFIQSNQTLAAFLHFHYINKSIQWAPHYSKLYTGKSGFTGIFIIFLILA